MEKLPLPKTYPRSTLKGKESIRIYGQDFPSSWSDLKVELESARVNLNGEAAKHLERAALILCPNLIFHAWIERIFKAHTEGWSTVSLAGCASSGKTFAVSILALLFWLTNPRERGVVLASTTIDSLKARIWGQLVAIIGECPYELPTQIYHSKPPCILYDKDFPINGIFTAPLIKGKSEETLGNLIGRKYKEGFMVVVDESTDVAPGFIDAKANWEISAPFFQLWALGNSKDQEDPHGQLCTPKNGWGSINPDYDTEWETNQGI